MINILYIGPRYPQFSSCHKHLRHGLRPGGQVMHHLIQAATRRPGLAIYGDSFLYLRGVKHIKLWETVESNHQKMVVSIYTLVYVEYIYIIR